MEKVEYGNLRFGDGNNTITAKPFGGFINMGKGDNTIYVETMNSADLTLATGNNLLLIESILGFNADENVKGNVGVKILSQAGSDAERQDMIALLESAVGKSFADFKADLQKSYDLKEMVF